MEFHGCRNANPKNKRIMTVVGRGVESNDIKNDEVEKTIALEDVAETIKRPVVLDLGSSALHLIGLDDERNPLVAHVLVKTADDKYMVNQKLDSSFNEAILKDVEISCDKKIVSLPVEVKENVAEGLQLIGIDGDEIDSISLELLETDIGLTAKTKNEIINKLQSLGIDKAKMESMSLGSLKDIVNLLNDVIGLSVDESNNNINTNGCDMSAPLKLFESDAVEGFYVAEVSTKLTEEQIKSRLDSEYELGSNYNSADFAFHDRHEFDDFEKEPEAGVNVIDSSIRSDKNKLLPSISRYLKKICHIS